MADELARTENAQRAAAAYGAAADHYDLPALSFWNRFGAATVARLRLRTGSHVLDLCSGAGGSAISAAHVVGESGHVIGIDVAEPLLRLARARAAREGLGNIEFRCADATQSGLRSQSFDAVVCVFGVFFAADMPGFVREMWRMVKPGGRLAVTTWGEQLFAPAIDVFWDAVRAVDPSLVRAFNPWDQITTADALRTLLAGAGVDAAAAEIVVGEHRLAQPDAFWDVVLGSGYRATVDGLPEGERSAVRAEVLEALRKQRVTAIKTDVVFGTGRRG